MNDKFIEQGNISIIEEVCKPASRLLMVRYEAIMDFCMNEPAFIHVFKSEAGDRITCEPILRIMIDVLDEHMTAHTIYSDEREGFQDGFCIVLRSITWDKASDTEMIKQYPERREEHLVSWPSIKSRNIVFDDTTQMKEIIQETDMVIRNGITLQDRNHDEMPFWSDVKIMRRYDWGEMCCCWGTSVENTEVERLIFSLAEKFSSLSDKQYATIYKAELDYRLPIDLYHKIAVGKKV